VFFDLETRRLATGNVAIAGDFFIGKIVAIEAGFFTDFSSALRIPENPDRYYNARINRLGGTLSVGFNVAASQPMVFLPAVLAGVIGALIYWATTGSMGYTTALLSIVATIITFVLNFASIDMSRDAYQGETLDLGESVSYVTGRIVEFIVAAIVGGLMAVTIILIPVVILMFVVMVMDETGITDAVSKSLNVLRADLGDVLLILLVSIVGSFVISYVPFVSALLDAALNVVIGLAFIDLYANYKSG